MLVHVIRGLMCLCRQNLALRGKYVADQEIIEPILKPKPCRVYISLLSFGTPKAQTQNIPKSNPHITQVSFHLLAFHLCIPTML